MIVRRVILLPALCLALLATDGLARAAQPLPVVVSLPAQKYLLEKIAGDAVSVTVLLTKGADPHTFEPVPAQMRAMAESRLFFTIGLPFEKAWLPRLAGAAPNLKTVDMTAGIKRLSLGDDAARLEELGIVPHHDEQDHDHDHEGEDPHVWLSPMLVRTMLPNIVKALAAERPEDAARFRAAAKALDDELQALDAELAQVFAPFPKEKRVFLTLHPAWSYFAHNYELVEVSVEVDGKEPGPADMKRLVDLARGLNLHTVFVEPQFPKAPAEAVAANINAKVVVLDPLAENLPEMWRSVAAALAASFERK